MYARVEKVKENKNRVMGNCVSQKKKSNLKQSLGFTDNRLQSIAQMRLRSLKNQNQSETQCFGIDSDQHKPIQMLTVQQTHLQSNQRKLKSARQMEHPNAGTSDHNYAVGTDYPRSWARSNNTGHSEARAAANTLGIILGNNTNIVILSEREPCDSCQNDMRDIENSSENNISVTVKYLVDNDNDAPENLRNIYQAL
ncbi:MAG TPA: hypothetical protein VHY08_27600 [Bacillota bacterium]|nr:hypothetical protein [Bacillota bacterium]